MHPQSPALAYEVRENRRHAKGPARHHADRGRGLAASLAVRWPGVPQPWLSDAAGWCGAISTTAGDEAGRVRVGVSPCRVEVFVPGAGLYQPSSDPNRACRCGET